jgi:hypothetical protein
MFREHRCHVMGAGKENPSVHTINNLSHVHSAEVTERANVRNGSEGDIPVERPEGVERGYRGS